MSARVVLRSVSKRYGAIAAAREVTFTVSPGEIFGLIGPNGAGKTTLLECVLGLIAPDMGTIEIDGIEVGRAPDRTRLLVGAQLQNSALPDAMTPLQALTLCASFYTHPADPNALLRQFDLTEKAGARFATLSAGQRQRLALALALVGRPRVLVLDEPTAGLDPTARAELHRLIRALPEAGCTVLFSTHYLEEARELCARVGVMHRGRILAVDTPAALIAASGAHARVTLRTRPRLPEALRADPELRGAEPTGEDGWTVAVAQAHRALAALLRHVEASGAELLEVSVQPPTLDDAFAALTARHD